MNRLPFSLSPGHFAQPVVESTAVINGQALVDALADCSMEEMNQMADLLEQEKFAEAGKFMASVLKNWME